MRLLHLSDTHLAAPGHVGAHPELEPLDRLREVLAAATAHGPFDAVVHTGDVCDDGSVEGAQAVRDVLAPLAPVVLAVPGNHDRSVSVRSVFGMPRARLGRWRLVGVETQVPDEVSGVAVGLAALLDEVDTASAAGDDGPVLVLMHHPLRSRSTHEWFVLRGGEAVTDRLTRHTGALAVLTGHTHEAYDETLPGGVRLLGAPSTFYGIHLDGRDWSLATGTTGARLVDLHDDGSVTTSLVLA